MLRALAFWVFVVAIVVGPFTALAARDRGRGNTVVYGTAGMINTFEVIAVDESGNRSAPATFTVEIF